MTSGAKFRQTLGVAFGALLVLSAVAFLYRARGLFLLFGAAVALSAAARPVADGFVRRGIGRALATVIAYLGGMIMVGAYVFVMFGVAASEIGPAGGHLLRRYELLVAQLSDGGRVAQLLAGLLPRPDASGVVSGLLPPNDGGATAFNITSTALELVVSILIVFMFSLYWSRQRALAMRFFLSLLPATQRAWVRHVIEDIETSVGSLILNEGLKSMVVSIALALLFRILRLPFPTFPALVIGLLRVVPLAGKALALLVAALAGAAAGPFQLVSAPLVTLATFLIVDRAAHRVLSYRDLDPLLGIFLAFVTWNVYGWTGLLLAPPLAAALQTAIESALAMKRSGGPRVPLGWEEIALRQQTLNDRARSASFRIPRATAALLRRLDDLMRVIRDRRDGPGKGQARAA